MERGTGFVQKRKKSLDRKFFRCYNDPRGDEKHPLSMGL